jgi:hypothetical protein
VQHRHQLQVRGGVDRHHLAHETFVIKEAPIDGLLLLQAATQAPQPLPLRLQLQLHAGGPLLAAVAQRR